MIFAAASKWGICSIGVHTGHGGQDSKVKADPDYWQDDLWNAVEFFAGKCFLIFKIEYFLKCLIKK